MSRILAKNIERSLGFMFGTVAGTFRSTPETHQDEAEDGKFMSCWQRGEQMPQMGDSQTSTHRHHLEGA